MARLIGILVGLGFVLVAGISLISGVITYLTTEQEKPVTYAFHEHPKHVAFDWEGPFGTFDRAQLQRGFQVYREVCASCHGLEYVAFRNLGALGYTEAEVKAIAEQWPIPVPSVNPDTGEPDTRTPIPADYFPSPYANEVAARAANNNAVPPDLSLVVEAREGGAEYLYSLLTGYREVPANLPPEARPGQGLYYNPYFHSLNIAMPPPFTAAGQVTYADGTDPTISQMARDVTAFLTWASEPNMEERKRAGVATLIFLLVATALGYMSYRNVWAHKKPRKRKKVRL